MFLILVFLSSFSYANSQSRLLPLFKNAIETWDKSSGTETFYRPELRVIHQVFDRENMDVQWLRRFLKISEAPLPRSIPQSKSSSLPPISLQVVRMDVLKNSDDWMRDDIYCYFFLTDGAIPIGRVSQTYQGLTEGESFHFIPEDRVLYPMGGGVRSPKGQLIVDYGIIESDGDDIKKLHRLTEVIAELVIGVYSVLNPEEAAQWSSLREEIVALSKAIVSLDHDDRLATGTIILDEIGIRGVLGDRDFGEIQKIHQNNHFFNKWRYRLIWRLIKEEQ